MRVHVCIHTRARTPFCGRQREAQTPGLYRARGAELNASTSAAPGGQDRARNAPPGARLAAHRGHGGEGRREGHSEGRGQQGAPNGQALLQSRRDASGALGSKHTTPTAADEAGNIYLKP